MKCLHCLMGKVYKSRDWFFWRFRKIKVYALVGASGTGKSFRARMVAEKFNIPLMIDDGLLIKSNMILAGKSAKKANGKIQAVKISIFEDDKHRREVLKALKGQRFSLILILGTSHKMVNRIAERLELPCISKYIAIEEIASKDEIQLAQNSRSKGEHVIPVPCVAMTGDYSQIFYDSVKILFKNPFYFFWRKKAKSYEKSIVKPTFSQVGTPNFSQNAVLEMIKHSVLEFDPAIKIDSIRIRRQEGNTYSFYIAILIPPNLEILELSEELKKSVTLKVERYANLELQSVEIKVKGVVKSPSF